MAIEYPAGLLNAPPSLAALATSDRLAFERACWDRHRAHRDAWLEARELARLSPLALVARAIRHSIRKATR